MSGYNIQFRAKSQAGMGIGGKVLYSVLLIGFIVAGCVVASLMSADLKQKLAVRGWMQTPCTITRSRIIERLPYRCQLAYTYQAGGRQMKGSVIYPGYSGSDDYYEAQKLHDRYAKGAVVTCLVDPANATQAALEAPSVWNAAEMLLPLVFVLAGVTGIYFMWRPRRAARPELKHPLTFVGGFFSIFLAAGLGFLGLVIPQIVHAAAAQKWPQADCVIASSGVGSRVVQDKHGSHTDYFVQVLFHYKFSGRRYGSSRYQLISVSSSDERGKQRIVTGLPRGLKTVCYVNPLDPADAVLNRDYATDAAIEIGVPSIFVLVGGSGVLMALWMARKRHVEQVERHLSAGVKGPKELKTATSAASQCGGMLLMALVWNGLMGLFLCATFTDSQYRDLPIFVLVIMGMFVLAGLWIFYIAIKQLRLFLGVRVHVGIDPFPLSPGEKATVQWEISGRSELIRQLDIRFCSFSRTNLPIAMAVRGTTLSSDNLLDTTEANEIQSGRCSIEMPADADISGNVVWAIEVEINAGARASIKEEFPIQVVPIGAGQAATV